jgi:hypothetical protein
MITLLAALLSTDAHAVEFVADRTFSLGTGVWAGYTSTSYAGVGLGYAGYSFLPVELRFFPKGGGAISHDLQIHAGQALLTTIWGHPTIPVSYFAHFRKPLIKDLELALAPGATVAVGFGGGWVDFAVAAEGRFGVDWRIPKVPLELGGYLRPSVGVYGVGEFTRVGGGAVLEATIVWNK